MQFNEYRYDSMNSYGLYVDLCGNYHFCFMPMERESEISLENKKESNIL